MYSCPTTQPRSEAAHHVSPWLNEEKMHEKWFTLQLWKQTSLLHSVQWLHGPFVNNGMATGGMKYTFWIAYKNNRGIAQRFGYTVGVPTMSWILVADSQKPSSLTLMKVPFLIFWSYKSPRRAGSAQLACLAKFSRQARQSKRIKGMV